MVFGDGEVATLATLVREIVCEEVAFELKQ